MLTAIETVCTVHSTVHHREGLVKIIQMYIFIQCTLYSKKYTELNPVNAH